MGKKDVNKKGSEKKDGSGSGADGGVAVVLKMDLHCEGCAQKVKRTIKHLDGVENVKADVATKTLTVVGKVDPAKVKERVEQKTKKQVDLVSPQPPPPNKDKDKDKDKDKGGAKKSEENKHHGKGGAQKSDEKPEKNLSPADNNKKTEQKKPKEAAVATVLLKTKVHCDGCAHKINKIINKCEGVREVNVDLAKDQIILKGTMNMTEMLPYLTTKLKRDVEIVPSPKKNEGDNKKPKDGPSGDKKGKEAAKPDGDGEKKKRDGEAKQKGKAQEENISKIEVLHRMEYSGYPNGYGAYAYNPQQAQGSGYVAEYWNGPPHPPNHMNTPHEYMNVPPEYMNAPPHYLHAPQMFSDENPNACMIM